MKKFGDDRGARLSALVAYYGFFSLFPLLLVLVSVLGFVLAGNSQLRDQIVDSAIANFPVIGDQIRGNVGRLHGSVLGVVIGMATALWAGLGVVRSLQAGLHQIWDVPRAEHGSFFVRVGRALLYLGVLGVGITVSAGATGLVARLPLGSGSRLGGLVVSLALNFVFVTVAYHWLNSAHPSIREAAPGAAFAAAALTALQALGGFYVTNQIATASSIYGTFAIVIGLLAWLLLSAQVILIGAEIDVVTARRLWPRSLTGEHLTDADHRVYDAQAREQTFRPQQRVRTSFEAGEADAEGERAETDRASG